MHGQQNVRDEENMVYPSACESLPKISHVLADALKNTGSAKDALAEVVIRFPGAQRANISAALDSLSDQLSADLTLDLFILLSELEDCGE